MEDNIFWILSIPLGRSKRHSNSDMIQKAHRHQEGTSGTKGRGWGVGEGNKGAQSQYNLVRGW